MHIKTAQCIRDLVLIAAIGLAACGRNDSTEPASAATSASESTSGARETATADGTASRGPGRPIIEEELAYGEAPDRNLLGYLAMPADAVEPQPGLLVVHERWGLDDEVRAMARRLAGEGYVVLAVDLYGGETAQTPNAAQQLMAGVTGAPEATLANLRQGYQYLDRYALAPRVGVLGWGLGGTWALQLGLALPGELDAVVMYYGQILRDPAQIKALEVPLLGLFGANDASIPVADVQAFRIELRGAGKDAEIYIYSDADHAFANTSGQTYSAEAEQEAWQRTIAFLSRTLR